jgi:hypothetical protein
MRILKEAFEPPLHNASARAAMGALAKIDHLLRPDDHAEVYQSFRDVVIDVTDQTKAEARAEVISGLRYAKPWN